MTNKDIKSIFRERKVQVNQEAMDLIQTALRKEVIQMADRCKKGNYKRLTPESFWVALGDWGVTPSPRKITK
jgi:hypothetical protein